MGQQIQSRWDMAQQYGPIVAPKYIPASLVASLGLQGKPGYISNLDGSLSLDPNVIAAWMAAQSTTSSSGGGSGGGNYEAPWRPPSYLSVTRPWRRTIPARGGGVVYPNTGRSQYSYPQYPSSKPPRNNNDSSWRIGF